MPSSRGLKAITDRVGLRMPQLNLLVMLATKKLLGASLEDSPVNRDALKGVYVRVRTTILCPLAILLGS